MRTILVPVDFSDGTPQVAVQAASMARALSARVHLFHAVMPEQSTAAADFGPVYVRDSVETELRRARDAMASLKADMLAQGLEVAAVVREGHPVHEIMAEIGKTEAELVVLGSHRHGMIHDIFLGSVSRGVIRKSPCPVLVVPIRKPES